MRLSIIRVKACFQGKSSSAIPGSILQLPLVERNVIDGRFTLRELVRQLKAMSQPLRYLHGSPNYPSTLELSRAEVAMTCAETLVFSPFIPGVPRSLGTYKIYNATPSHSEGLSIAFGG